jgi:hypothetical protein
LSHMGDDGLIVPEPGPTNNTHPPSAPSRSAAPRTRLGRSIMRIAPLFVSVKAQYMATITFRLIPRAQNVDIRRHDRGASRVRLLDAWYYSVPRKAGATSPGVDIDGSLTGTPRAAIARSETFQSRAPRVRAIVRMSARLIRKRRRGTTEGAMPMLPTHHNPASYVFNRAIEYFRWLAMSVTVMIFVTGMAVGLILLSAWAVVA